MSEGTKLVRQVAFLKKGEGFVEGYGEAEDRNGKMVFKNTALLDFSSGSAFKKVPCAEQPAVATFATQLKSPVKHL